VSTWPAGQPVPPAADPHQGGWAGRGFTRPGPGAEVPRDLYRAALEDALAYTTDRDGCPECDPARLCESHAARAARVQQYQRALEQEMEPGEDTDNQRMTSGSPITISQPKTGKAATWATQAVLDAIHSGQLRAELLEDCDFWAAKAAQQRMQAQAETDPGPTERQLEDWNTHNDHMDGLTTDYDMDREA
jgi:hypothetical protein